MKFQTAKGKMQIVLVPTAHLLDYYADCHFDSADNIPAHTLCAEPSLSAQQRLHNADFDDVFFLFRLRNHSCSKDKYSHLL
jgi:hypothetical protein